MYVDPREKAMQLLTSYCTTGDDDIPTLAVAYGLVALCDRLDDLSCIVAVPNGEDDE